MKLLAQRKDDALCLNVASYFYVSPRAYRLLGFTWFHSIEQHSMISGILRMRALPRRYNNLWEMRWEEGVYVRVSLCLCHTKLPKRSCTMTIWGYVEYVGEATIASLMTPVMQPDNNLDGVSACLKLLNYSHTLPIPLLTSVSQPSQSRTLLQLVFSIKF